MQKQQDATKFEFLLTLEGNIIIQRFFLVYGYNPESKRSIDLHECVKNICNEIKRDLKVKSSDFTYDEQNYFYDNEDVEESAEKKEEHFLIEIKLLDDVFIQRIFPANVYHPKARYSVDIRSKIRAILADLSDVLSSDELETSYLEYEL